MTRKIKIKTPQERKIETLELENADLWYENILTKEQLTASNQEIADLWYEILLGGNV